MDDPCGKHDGTPACLREREREREREKERERERFQFFMLRQMSLFFLALISHAFNTETRSPGPQ
eukprot:COSAG03_NODE_1591_length_3822_cov_11.092130_2_plen_64_part_00